MRVIAGKAKGVKLKPPKGIGVRPTADRVKEALFNILAPRIDGVYFLDLYAGSGAIGIEALSRGAHYCVFVDYKKENTALIRDNLDITGLTEKARLITGDAEQAVIKLARDNYKAGLVYLDPPYGKTKIQPVVLSIFNHQVVDQGGLLIIEHDIKDQQWIEEFTNIRQKRYGSTCLSLISSHQ